MTKEIARTPDLSPESILAELDQIELELRQAFSQRNLQYSQIEAWRLFDQASQIVFNYRQSIDVAFATGQTKPPQPARLSNSRRLLNTLSPLLERQSQLRQSLYELYQKKYCRLISSDLPRPITLAAGILLDNDNYYDSSAQNPLRPLIIQTVASGLALINKVDLLLFSCPEIDAAYLTGPYPSDYIKTTANRNTGVINAKSILQLTKDLSAAGVTTRLNIIGGFTDEEDYIFPVLGAFNTNSSELQVRRSQYFANFTTQCQRIYANVPELNIVDWSTNPGYPQKRNITVPEQMISTEAERLAQLFQPGSYYGTLPLPTSNQLRQIAILKIKTYAQQGQSLKTLFPYTIGLQNEFPGVLRTQMINLCLDDDQIPFIYPFNPKESLY